MATSVTPLKENPLNALMISRQISREPSIFFQVFDDLFNIHFLLPLYYDVG